MSQSATDEAAIIRRRYEYALGIDSRDWDLYRSIFADEITMDFSSYSGQPCSQLSADDWVANCKVLFSGLDATQHMMSNPMVDVNGDHARLRMYMQAEHMLVNNRGDHFFTIGGMYDDELQRTAAGWQITAVTLQVFWQRGNRQIMDLAVQPSAPAV